MIRLILGCVFLAIGLFVFVSEVVGFFRFRYVMLRIHAAGTGDTLGLASLLIAAALLIGEPVASLKLLLILVFSFLTGPVVTHLVAKAESEIHNNAGHEYREEDRT